MKKICSILGSVSLTLLFFTLVYFFSWDEIKDTLNYDIGAKELFFNVLAPWLPVSVILVILGYLLGGKAFQIITKNKSNEIIKNNVVSQRNKTMTRVAYGIRGIVAGYILGFVLFGGFIFPVLPISIFLPITVFLSGLGYFIGAKMGESIFNND